MSMQFKLTINSLYGFIELAHKVLYERPYPGASSSMYLISYLDLAHKINALLWHGPGEYKIIDKTEDEAALINAYVEESIRKTFTVYTTRGGGASNWSNPESFATAMGPIWFNIIPGFWDDSSNSRYRGKMLDYYRNHPQDIDVDFLVEALKTVKNAIKFHDGGYDVCQRLAQSYGQIIFRKEDVIKLYLEIFKASSTVDESMTDEFWGDSEDMIQVLHNTAGDKMLDDTIYQIVYAISNMMITDSMVDNATFKLGEYAGSRVRAKSEYMMSGAPQVTEEKKHYTEVINPETGKMEAVEGELDLGKKDEKPVPHVMLTITKQKINEFVTNCVTKARAQIISTYEKIPISIQEEFESRTFDVSKGVAAKAVHDVACAVYGHNCLITNVQLDAIEEYLFQEVAIFYSAVHNDMTDTDELIDSIVETLINTLPRTMVHDIAEDESQWTYDLDFFRMISSRLGISFRNMIRNCYITREMDQTNFVEPQTNTDWTHDAEAILINMIGIAFNIPNRELIIKTLADRFIIYPLNMAPADLGWIIMNICLPQALGTIHEENRIVPDVNPIVNFPQKDSKPKITDDVNGDTDDKTEIKTENAEKGKKLLPDLKNAEETPKSSYTDYNMIYHLEEDIIEQFVFHPDDIRMVLKIFDVAHTRDGYPEVYLNQLGRFIYPHVFKDSKKYLISGISAIADLLANTYFKKTPTTHSSSMLGAVMAVVPTCGFPEHHLPYRDTDSEDIGVYKLTIDSLNSIQKTIMYAIFNAFGENRMMLTNKRPFKTICDLFMQCVYPIANFAGANWRNYNSIDGIKMLVDELRKLSSKMLKAELFAITEQRRELFGEECSPKMTRELMESDTEDFDLAQLGVSDKDIAMVIFYTMVHLCPYDDLRMNEAKSSEEEKSK